MFKYIGCHVLGIVVGAGAIVITSPHVDPLAHRIAHTTMSAVVKPIGGTIVHPLSGTFEHEVKRTE